MIAGLLLAAGAGRRMGQPKALVRGEDGVPWVRRSAQVLLDGGCQPVLAVLGAAAEEAQAELPDRVKAVIAPDWAEGMGASLRAGLSALAGIPATAVLISLVDTPGVNPAIVHRLREVAGEDESVLLRADYGTGPAHPVLIGRAHWAAAARVATGDRGARELLTGDGVRLIPCADLGDGADIDHPQAGIDTRNE